MWYFFASPAGEVPWAFKICGLFQACCDLGLGAQWVVWRDGPEGVAGGEGKELRSPPPEREGGFEMVKGVGGGGVVGRAPGGGAGYEL